MISILIVDDHAIVRRGLRGILSESSSVDVIGEAADYGEMRALMQK
jgi:DNA-binding NarL/FixJ family response regulator